MATSSVLIPRVLFLIRKMERRNEKQSSRKERKVMTIWDPFSIYIFFPQKVPLQGLKLF